MREPENVTLLCRGRSSWVSDFQEADSDRRVVRMEFGIRPVRASDHTDVMGLAPRLLVGVDPSRPTELVHTAIQGWVDESVRSAGSDDRAGWVAEHDGSVIGFVSVSVEDHWCGEEDAWVGELMVDERFERKGVARALIAKAKEWAAQRSLGHIRLTTGAANQGARAFYERLGYGLNEVTMTRELPAKPTA
jgi:GNAT superfamily N-acetyltransferase